MSKISYAWIALAVVVFVLIVTRMDQKMFGGDAVVDVIQKKAGGFSSKMTSTRSKLKDFVADKDLSKFKLVDPDTIPQEDGAIASSDQTTLRVSGVMQADGVMSAYVNGSLVQPGGMVLGCEVLEVLAKGVSFDISGEKVTVPVGGEHSINMVKAVGLTLAAIEKKDGRYFALIGGRSYKAGDWVDGDTRVKAVMPTMIMIDSDGNTMTLKVGDSL